MSNERGLITTDTINQYRTTLDETTRRLAYCNQEMLSLTTMVTDLLSGASTTLLQERNAARDSNADQIADWTLRVGSSQARMQAELDTHLMTPWFMVHGKAYYTKQQFYDKNGWLLGMHRLVFTGPYPGWRVEVPAHPDKQGPGGDSMVDCWTRQSPTEQFTGDEGFQPCIWTNKNRDPSVDETYARSSDVHGGKYVVECPESNAIAVNAKNHQKRRNVIRAYWPKTDPSQDCPNEWKAKTVAWSAVRFGVDPALAAPRRTPNDDHGSQPPGKNQNPYVPIRNAQATEAIGIVFRIGSVARSTPWLIPAKLYKGDGI